MSCVHTLFTPCDGDSFTHRLGILHLHKSVMVEAVCVALRNAYGHTAPFVLQTLYMTPQQEINSARLRGSIKPALKESGTTPNAG